MIADTLLIPFILLLVCGMKFSNSGNNYFFDDLFITAKYKGIKRNICSSSRYISSWNDNK